MQEQNSISHKTEQNKPYQMCWYLSSLSNNNLKIIKDWETDADACQGGFTYQHVNIDFRHDNLCKHKIMAY